jgi:hypothetical protein
MCGSASTHFTGAPPSLFELTRAGVEIVLDTGPSASDAFGGSAPQLPPGAQIDAAVQAPAAAPAIPQQAAPAPQPAAAPPVQQAVAPAPDFLNPPGAAPAAPAAPEPVRYQLNGQAYTEAQLVGANWTPEQIAALPRA